MDSSFTTPKCLVCFCTIQSERTKNSEQFGKVFDIFCRLLKVDLIQPMQWNFEQDHIPFCEFCRSAVEELKDLYDQIQSLQQQTTNVLNRIKRKMRTSSGSNSSKTSEVATNNRVNYFRHLVVGGSFHEDKGGNHAVKAEVTSLNNDPSIQVEKHIGRHNSTEFPLLEGIIVSNEFEDGVIESDPLLTVKQESDCVIDVESFPLDNLDSLTDSVFQTPNNPACRVQEVDSRTEEMAETDGEKHQRCRFCKKTFRSKLSLHLHLKQHLDETKPNSEKGNEMLLSSNDLIVHQKQVHGNIIPKHSEIVSSERKLVIKLARIDLPLNGAKSSVKNDGKSFSALIKKGNTSSEQFSNHKRSHVMQKPFSCDVCNKTFTRLKLLTIHKNIHKDIRPYKCEICNKSFGLSITLIYHKRIHTGERPYKCEVCNKTFTRPQTFVVHKRIHSGERPYKCDTCNKTFGRSAHLTSHKRMHTGERPYKCVVCNKTFTTSRYLNIHNRIHTGERPYKCKVCSKTFSYRNALTKHTKIHTSERPYQCDVCNTTFTRPEMFTVHKIIHTGERPYKCDLCNKGFKLWRSLLRHRHKCIQTSEKPFNCEAEIRHLSFKPD